MTYAGNSGGAGGDGADGISFFLQDGTQAPGLGAFGGSLAYSCSNANTPHDGLTGGYIGLGIDEYGNFLNGTNLVAGYTGTNVATGDNAAYGYGYKPGRIGLRGAGSISGAALTAAYGSDPSNTALPYYPASLATSCVNAGGVYSAATNNCTQICSAGSTWDPVTQVCNKACTGGATYSASTDTCNSCSSVNGTYNGTTQQCTNTNQCAAGTYFSGTATCDTCPATGYGTGTYSSGTGMCTNSCPAGYTISGTSCYPIGAVYGSGYYCPGGSAVPTNNSGTYVCYTSGLSYSAGNYCPSGYTISGTSCYPNSDSHSGTNYCPAGQTISGTSCFPTATPALSTSGAYYCTAGLTISGTSCYPTASPALAHSGTNYCPISGNTISTTHCCPSGYTWNAASGLCKNGAATAAATAATPMTAASPMTAAMAMTAAIPATAATAVTAAQTVTPNQSPTLITTPVESAPATLPPTTGNVDLQYAVKNTCATGNLYNYSIANAPTSAGPALLSNTANTAGILDYAPIPNGYKELTSFQIANEGATTRGAATPIFYNLKITQDGLLSFAYSVSGGAYSYVIRNQQIFTTNGPLPASFRVGFAGSDGGATNIHEVMCFKAASATQSGSSATANQKEVAKVQEGPQAYFAFYNPNDWTGTVTANTLTDNSQGVVSVATTPNWDASCLLTWSSVPAASGGGCATTASPPSGTPTPAGRIMLTWDTVNNVGIPFEWGSLNNAQQSALDFGDATPGNTRLNYLRGDRSNEINSNAVGLYRARDTALGDIVDSSPAYVGPPASPYTAKWRDRLYGGVMPENTGTQTYLQYAAAEQTRLNVVYIGSNDGFLHGFRAGSFDANGNFVANSTTPNDGQEVLAYMPGSVLASAALPSAAGGCTNGVNTQTQVQGIHGVTPAVGTTSECTEPLLDYANTLYGHNFFVDATPGSGELFYGGQWHTWLVGGLGVGGAAIYALDVTNPSGSNFTEGNASSIIIGEWNPSSIVCAIGTNCGNNLGNTFGTPQIRRLHNGNWAVIFGNGFGSNSGDAGIYIMSIDNASGAQTFYYLSTNTAGGNGIAYATPADMDGDHITDYVYAGDLLGNVWRFDLTSNNPAYWGVTNAGGVSINALTSGGGAATPLFTTQSGQPITTQLLVISSNVSGGPPRFLIEFGTGERTQITNLAPAQYASGVQSMYGVWDWNLSAWNALSPGAAQASLPTTTAATGLAAPYTLTYANLQAQTLTLNSTAGVVDGTNVAICWQGSTTCSGNSFGWYANLPGTSEQIIFNPVFQQGSFTVNSTVPANNVATTCESKLDTGFTYALNIANGGVFTNTFPTYTKNGTIITDAQEAGVETDATGSVYFVNTPQGKLNIVYQTISGTPGAQQLNIPPNGKAKRLTWIERR